MKKLKFKSDSFKSKIHPEATRQRHQLHHKMECRSLCLNIEMWVKKV